MVKRWKNSSLRCCSWTPSEGHRSMKCGGRSTSWWITMCSTCSGTACRLFPQLPSICLTWEFLSFSTFSNSSRSSFEAIRVLGSRWTLLNASKVFRPSRFLSPSSRTRWFMWEIFPRAPCSTTFWTSLKSKKMLIPKKTLSMRKKMSEGSSSSLWRKRVQVWGWAPSRLSNCKRSCVVLNGTKA